jgi:ribosomal-protein-alanine N-acetyltransferase
MENPDIVPTILLDRVILRELRMTDAEDLLVTYSDAHAMRFRANPPLTSLDDARRMIETAHREAVDEKKIRWAIEEKSSGGVIGTFLWIIEKGKTVSEIGYSLRKDRWNYGLSTEIVRDMCEYLFMHEAVDTLTAKVHRDNFGSIRVLEKTGFVKSGENGTHWFYRRSR